MKASVAVALGCVCWSGAISAADGDRYELDIPRQRLDAALTEFAQQTGLQIAHFADAMNGDVIVGPVSGKLSKAEALQTLLKPQGLSFVVLGERMIAVVDPTQWKSSPTPIGPTESETTGLQRIQFTESPAEPDGLRGSGGPPAASGHSDTVDEIVVTGSRLRQSSDGGTVPVTTFDREKIQQLGVESVADVLNFLPQQSFSRAESFAVAGSRVAQLRGLGVGTTLVLVNGRRTITSALLGSTGAFDLNTIPLSAVDRIEVLSSSASAVYGADAVGGVINVILRSGIDQPTLDLYYGGADGGAREKRGSIALGHDGERFRSTLILDYFKRGILSGERREMFADSDFRRYGSTDRRSAFSNPTTISSLNAQNLPGLPARFAAVPQGSSGVDLTPEQFIPTAGSRNMESLNRYTSIVSAAERKSAVATLALNVTDSTTAFGELMYADRDAESAGTPSSITATIPASNPFNPFGVPVSATYLFSELGPRWTLFNSESTRAVAGIKGEVRSDYDWEVSLLSIRESGEETLSNRIDNARVNAALAQTDRSAALNFFKDGPSGTPALLASLIGSPVTNTFASNALQGSAFLTGPVMSLPAGTLDFAIGAEWREEDLLLNSVSGGVRVDADRASYSAFQELRVPVVSLEQNVWGVRSLTAAIAGRYDHYNDFGSTYNPEFRIEWGPLQGLLVRASYGNSFRAPSLFELYSPSRVSAGSFADPRRGNQVVPLTVVSGGNPDLEPEEATSLVAGFALSLPEYGNLQVDASYWRISQDSRVQRLPTGLVLANEAVFPGRVYRADPTPDDIAAGVPGTLLSVDITGVNFGSLETAGIDARVTGEVVTRFGTWSANLALTWIDTYEAADLPGTPASERVGIANNQGSIPRWRTATTLAWSHGVWGAAATLRDMASYDDVNTLNLKNGRVVDPQRIVDLQASMNLSVVGWRALRGIDQMKIRAGVSNLFDKGPSFSEVNASGFDIHQADLRQRFAYASITLGF